jgi:hypothetical protein
MCLGICCEINKKRCKKGDIFHSHLVNDLVCSLTKISFKTLIFSVLKILKKNKSN